MHLLFEIRSLQRRSEVSQRRCECHLVQLTREDHDIGCNEAILVSQEAETQNLLKMQQIERTVLGREQLYTLLRKQALLQYQLQNIKLQITQLQEQRQVLSDRRTKIQNERQIWLRKYEKYERWTKRIRHQARLLQLQLDEAEQEDRRSQWSR
ncbi:hypothetical protein [Yokenella regensburgei]|uniref:hypothetical protein n=1 Tax=Yokenella regensburgei TaxID=158877 RepID=UPI001432B904|nr:hypothetical protein [Yokenella regensburgei]QIU92579.1 hypothetical protein HEC60_25030 [Yokenella regensburgei]